MKPILYVLTVSSLLPCVGAICRAQDTAAPAPPTSGGGSANSASDTQRMLQRAEMDRTEQGYRTRLGVIPTAHAAGFSDRLQNIVRHSSGGFGGGGSSTLIINSSEMSPEARAKLDEDLAVMGRVLDKALEEAPGRFQPSTAMGINLAFAPDVGGRMRSLYLDDYGAVFLLRVGYPLLRPPPMATDEKKEKEPTDPAWEEAKSELYGQPGGPGMPGGHVEEFSQERVNKLKEALLASLKSAANIRGLKPNEFITVCVFGAPAGDTLLYGGGSGVAWASNGPLIATEQHMSSSGSVLTMRVKKEDVDNFAKGTVNLEGFKTFVHVELYPSGSANRRTSGGFGGGVGGEAGGGGGSGGGSGGKRF